MEKAYAENKDLFATTAAKQGMGEDERLSKEKQLECVHDELTHVWAGRGRPENESYRSVSYDIL